MTPAACSRHPRALAHHGLCTACLIEEAIAGVPDQAVEPIARFTVQLPLGARDAAAVFLVLAEWPWRRLLRLKTWSHPAPDDFVRRFAALRSALDHLHDDSIVRPVAGWTDAAGRPCVLSEFRQGVPLLDRVRAGKLPPDDARVALGLLREGTIAAHARGLVHGSVVSGNVLSGSNGAFLLDFGLALVVGPGAAGVASSRSDLAGFEQLELSLRELG